MKAQQQPRKYNTSGRKTKSRGQEKARQQPRKILKPGQPTGK